MDTIKSFLRKRYVIFVLLYVLFYSMWEDLINITLVEPFISHFERNYISDIVFLILSLFFILYSFTSKPKYHKSKDYIFISIIVVCFWGYYRFWSPRFDFLSLFTIECVKYIDIIAIYTICYFFRCNKKLDKSCCKFENGYERDAPITNKEDDLFNRRIFADDLVDKLLKTDTTQDAFSLGIVSQWGTGKTSFMNFMKAIINKEHNDDCIVIDFNPWLYTNKADIISLFFDELSKSFDKSLAYSIIDYSKALSAIGTPEIKIASTFVDLLSTQSKIEDKRNIIKELLISRKKRIVVFVDDIDRLDASEIMEVLKLIRNVSNFPYMYFVVSYDKEYLLQSLRDKIPSKSLDYTEKIFQTEFVLPQCDMEKIKDCVYQSISLVVDEEEKKDLYDTIWSKNNIIEDNIVTIRDVKRIVNFFKTSFSKLKGEISASNLLLLEILKNKYPAIYLILERERKKVLVANYSHCYELFDEKNVDKNDLYANIVNEKRYNIKTYINDSWSQLHIKETDKNRIFINSLIPATYNKYIRKEY